MALSTIPDGIHCKPSLQCKPSHDTNRKTRERCCQCCNTEFLCTLLSQISVWL